MDEALKSWLKLWAFLVALALIAIFSSCESDRYHTRRMAEKGFCHVRHETTNVSPTYVWIKCK